MRASTTARPAIRKRSPRTPGIIHIDIDPREFGKIKAVDVSICADAGFATRELLERVQLDSASAVAVSSNNSKQGHPLRTPGSDDLCSHRTASCKQSARCAPDDVIVTTDVGQHQMWVAQRFLSCAAGSLAHIGQASGTMGFGPPAAIGAALVSSLKQRRVCFTGDGSLLMNVQELATLAELGLNVKIVLLDNGAARPCPDSSRNCSISSAWSPRRIHDRAASGALSPRLSAFRRWTWAIAADPHDALSMRDVGSWRQCADPRADRRGSICDADGGAGRRATVEALDHVDGIGR